MAILSIIIKTNRCTVFVSVFFSILLYNIKNNENHRLELFTNMATPMLYISLIFVLLTVIPSKSEKVDDEKCVAENKICSDQKIFHGMVSGNLLKEDANHEFSELQCDKGGVSRVINNPWWFTLSRHQR